MDANEFLRILRKADGQLGKEERKGLLEILRKYPYFQAAYALRLKSLHLEKHPDYPAELSKTASHTSDREVLYDLINEEPFVQNTIANSLERMHTVAHEAWRQTGGEVPDEELPDDGPYTPAEHYPIRTEDPNLFVPVDRSEDASDPEGQTIYEGGGSREAGFSMPEGDIHKQEPESPVENRREVESSDEAQEEHAQADMRIQDSEVPEENDITAIGSELPDSGEWKDAGVEGGELPGSEEPTTQDTPSAQDDSSLWDQIDAATTEEDMEAELLSGIPLNLDEDGPQEDHEVPDRETEESLNEAFFGQNEEREEEDTGKSPETPDYWEGETRDWSSANSEQEGDSVDTEPWMNEVIEPLDTSRPVQQPETTEKEAEEEAVTSGETHEPEPYDPDRETKNSKILGETLREAFTPGEGEPAEEQLEDSYSQILGIENERTRNIELSADTEEYEPSVAEKATDQKREEEAIPSEVVSEKHSTEPGRLSFLDWISRTDEKTREPAPASSEDPEKARKFELVDRFIQSNPRIDVNPATEDNPQKNEFSDSGQDTVLFTETLAQLYREQGNYEKALAAYHALQLKYPEKSSYFAALIEEVKELQRNK
jgi:hypothetical protein